MFGVCRNLFNRNAAAAPILQRDDLLLLLWCKVSWMLKNNQQRNLITGKCFKPPWRGSRAPARVSSEAELQQEEEQVRTLESRLQSALQQRKAEAAWPAFERLTKLSGFSRPRINQLLLLLTYSDSTKWLIAAHNLAIRLWRLRRFEFLSRDALALLLLCLARAHLPLHASTILRIALQIHEFPPLKVLHAAFSHLAMSSPVGAYLAAQLLLEISDLFVLQHKPSLSPTTLKPPKRLLAMRPDAALFQLVLKGCLAFDESRKAARVFEAMRKLQILPDVAGFLMICSVLQKCGRREVLKGLEKWLLLVRGGAGSKLLPWRQLYGSMLQMHFDFEDLDSASELVLDMLRGGLSECRDFQVQSDRFPIFPVEVSTDLVEERDGKLVPSEIVYAKLAETYLRADRAAELTHILLQIDDTFLKNTAPAICGVCNQVIEACIEMGWTDHAQDMMDEMKAFNVAIWHGLYRALLNAYCIAGRRIEFVLREVKNLGLKLEAACYQELIRYGIPEAELENWKGLFTRVIDTKTVSCRKLVKQYLVNFLRENNKQVALARVKEINSVIDFFCKKRMMDDAKNAYKSLLKSGCQPNVQMFEDLINGYSSEGMFREVTVLWGEMKIMAEDTDSLRFDRELLDTLVCCFVMGGYFARTLEVISFMEEQNMFVDKWKYKKLYLETHKNLYEKPRSCKSQSENHLSRIEHVKQFKKWVGII